MVLKNSDEGIEISFKTVEKEDEEVEVHFFFFFFQLIRIQKSGYHNIIRILKSEIYSKNGFNKSDNIPDIKIRIVLLLPDL